jgi:hypothetical protein
MELVDLFPAISHAITERCSLMNTHSLLKEYSFVRSYQRQILKVRNAFTSLYIKEFTSLMVVLWKPFGLSFFKNQMKINHSNVGVAMRHCLI